MADKLGLGNGERQLKLGQSFTNPKSSAFHTVRYDFKPASVDINKMASVEVGSNNQVTVTVPHLDGAGVPQTVFKGSQRPYHKECVLIIDRVTGVITLEKLSSNIQVKKTRSEAIKPPLPQVSSSSDRNTPNPDRLNAGGLGAPNRPQTPPIGQRTSNKTRVTSGSRRPDRPITHLVPKHSPLHASPSYSSPGHYKSPKRDHLVNNNTNNNDTHSQSILASLPMIGMDDVAEPPVPVVPHSSSSSIGVTPPTSKRSPPVLPVQQQQIQQNGRDLIGEISDTSSSSSDSDSGSDHETTTASNVKLKSGSGAGGGSSSGANASTTGTSRRNGHHANGFAFGSNSSPSLSMPAHILSEDLCLSESGSDSD